MTGSTTTSWRSLYSGASAFAFLSEYEGFGLTPLEALASGVPPVVLDTPVAREVYGDAAVYVPRRRASTLVADALERRAWPERRASAGARARRPRVLARYDWRRTAAATLAVLEEAAAS